MRKSREEIKAWDNYQKKNNGKTLFFPFRIAFEKAGIIKNGKIVM
jgi:hypothetical protein